MPSEPVPDISTRSPVFLLLGQRQEKTVDGMLLSVRRPRGVRCRRPGTSTIVGVGRNHIDVIGLDPGSVRDWLTASWPGASAARQAAGVLGIEVLNEDEGHTRIGGEMAKQRVNASRPPAEAQRRQSEKRLAGLCRSERQGLGS